MDEPVSQPNLFSRFFGFISSSSSSRTLGALAILIVAAAIPLTVYIAQQRQETRQQAATGESSGPATGARALTGSQVGLNTNKCAVPLASPPRPYKVPSFDLPEGSCTDSPSEIKSCGGYYEKLWCEAKASGNSKRQEQVTLCCRGTDGCFPDGQPFVYMSFLGRAWTLSAALPAWSAQWGPDQARRSIWNYLMRNLKSSKIAFESSGNVEGNDYLLSVGGSYIFPKVNSGDPFFWWGAQMQNEINNGCAISSNTWNNICQSDADCASQGKVCDDKYGNYASNHPPSFTCVPSNYTPPGGGGSGGGGGGTCSNLGEDCRLNSTDDQCCTGVGLTCSPKPNSTTVGTCVSGGGGGGGGGITGNIGGRVTSCATGQGIGGVKILMNHGDDKLIEDTNADGTWSSNIISTTDRSYGIWPQCVSGLDIMKPYAAPSGYLCNSSVGPKAPNSPHRTWIGGGGFPNKGDYYDVALDGLPTVNGSQSTKNFDFCYTPASNPPVTSTPIPTATPRPTGTSIPSSTPIPSATSTPAPGSTTLSFNLSLQGVGGSGNPSPLNPTRKLKVLVFNNNNQQVGTERTGDIIFDSQSGLFKGTINLGVIPSGAYTIKVKTEKYLRKLISGVQNLKEGLNQMPQAIMIVGDMNNDNKLNIGDYNILVSCFGSKANSSSCGSVNKQAADLNDDGKVSDPDYKLFIDSLSVQEGD